MASYLQSLPKAFEQDGDQTTRVRRYRPGNPDPDLIRIRIKSANWQNEAKSAGFASQKFRGRDLAAEAATWLCEPPPLGSANFDFGTTAALARRSRGSTATVSDSSGANRHCLIVAPARITAVSALARSGPEGFALRIARAVFVSRSFVQRPPHS